MVIGKKGSDIDKLRADPESQTAPNTEKLLVLARDYKRRLKFDDIKKTSSAIERIAELSTETSRCFALYIRQQQPTISFQGRKGIIFARMDHVDGDGIWLDIGGIQTKKELFDPDVQHEDLAQKSVKNANLSQDHYAAYAWTWRMSDGNKNPFNDPALKEAAKLFAVNSDQIKGSKNEKPQSLLGKYTYHKSRVSLGEVGKEALNWFEGDNLTLKPNGVMWQSNEARDLKSVREPEIPVLKLKEELKPPFTIEMGVQVDPKSTMLMGIREGERAIRLGFDLRTQAQTKMIRIGGIINSSQGKLLSLPLPKQHPSVKSRLNLKVHVNEMGKVTFFVNGKEYKVGRKAFTNHKGNFNKKNSENFKRNGSFRLPSEEPMQFVFQALNNTGEKSGVRIESLYVKLGE